MAEKQTIQRSRAKARKGRSPSTQAGEFVREEMRHIRKGKHGARSTQQAIAIGLSKARRAGVRVPKRGGEKSSESSSKSASHTRTRTQPSARRSRATSGALKREPRSAASHEALSRQARKSAASRGSGSRKQAALRAVRTKGSAEIRSAARKAARTRQRRSA